MSRVFAFMIEFFITSSTYIDYHNLLKINTYIFVYIIKKTDEKRTKNGRKWDEKTDENGTENGRKTDEMKQDGQNGTK